MNLVQPPKLQPFHRRDFNLSLGYVPSSSSSSSRQQRHQDQRKRLSGFPAASFSSLTTASSASFGELLQVRVLILGKLAMLLRWSRTFTRLSKLTSHNDVRFQNDIYGVSNRNCAKVAAAPSLIPADSLDKHFPSNTVVNLNKMFKSKPSSLALAPDSPLRIEEPKHEGISLIIFKMLLFYSKTSKSIRGANVVYSRIRSRVDKPAIYEVFNIEKTFKTTFSLLVLHMWLYLRRLKEDGKEGVEFGQHLYEIYNQDLELRVHKAGVNLLLPRWMKDLEKIFYGNIVTYDAAMLPKAKQNELLDAIWRNVFSDDGTSKPNDVALQAVQAMARYARRESICLSLTEKEALYSGNFMFTPLKDESQAEVEGPS